MRVGRTVRVTLAVAIVSTCSGACRRGELSSADSQSGALPAVATLRAPSPAAAHDLDLHLHWRSARLRQALAPVDARWSYRQYSDVIVLHGEGHRALLLLPSRDGSPAMAAFRVELPRDGACELIAWVAIEPGAGVYSNGIDYGIAIGGDDREPHAASIQFARLDAREGTTAWRPIRVDLSTYRGRVVWIVLAARERGSQSGDWLLWGDPRVRLVPESPVVVDLQRPDPARRRPNAIPWSELNVFKAYTYFNEDAVRAAPFRAIGAAAPWVRSLRLFSALGGNWGPTLEREYDQQIGQNPGIDSTWERRWAPHYEFFRDGPEWESRPIDERFDWARFDRLLDDVAATGLALHVQLAGAPERFTGGHGAYPSYHYNELPVVDEAGWERYVDVVFAHLATRPWFGNAQFSFFSEPNCVWVNDDGSVRRFGYQGDPEQYARQYVATWRAMRNHVAAAHVHLGPWVVEPDRENPSLDNLPAFLRALHAEFDRRGAPLPPWSAFAFNVYETPRLALDGVAEYKLDYARRIVADEFPGIDLPVRFDEVGIHPLLKAAFEHAGSGPLELTSWALAWHAEMLALLVDRRVQQAGPWFEQYEIPGYLAYIALTYALGALDYTVTPVGDVALHATAPETPDASVRLAEDDPSRVGYAWSIGATGERARLAVWELPRYPSTDARLDRTVRTEVTIRLPDGPAGWRVTVMGRDDLGAAVPGAGAPRQLRVPGIARSEMDAVDVAAAGNVLRLAVGPATMLMLDARRIRDRTLVP